MKKPSAVQSMRVLLGSASFAMWMSDASDRMVHVNKARRMARKMAPEFTVAQCIF